MDKHKLELNLDIHNRVVQYVNRKDTLVDECLEAYNKSVGDVDLEVLDKLAEIPTKEESGNE